ncbi:hypothetical protein LNM54_004660, partial [Salmonella enterica subsp. enterica]|nr:hypothetical protein [Salmonella enterica subsp. enterica]
KKQIKILFFLLLLLGAGGVIFYFLAYIIYMSMFVQGIASLFVLFVFSIVIFFTRKFEVTVLTLSIVGFSWFSMFFDARGNIVYNKPLEWIFQSDGILLFKQHVSNYRPGEYDVIYSLILEKHDGTTHELSLFILYGYRFIQYLILLFIVGYLIRKIPCKNHNNHSDNNTTIPGTLSKDDISEIISLLKSGDKPGAIKLTTDISGVSLKTSKKYVDWIEKHTSPPPD